MNALALTPAILVLLLIITGTLSAAIVGLIVYHRQQQKIAQLRTECAALATRLEMERQASGERVQILEQARQQLADSFAALSSQALRVNNEEFLRLAGENLKQFQQRAEQQLQEKEKSIEGLVNPIREALNKTEQQIQAMEQARQHAYGSLTQQLEQMAKSQTQLQQETRNLVQALRRPEVRGQWGELTLRRLVELAGMVDHCDFYEQETQTSYEGGVQRPDMIVRLPDARDIVVDVKTPLDAYLSAMEAGDDNERQRQLERHARKVRERVTELAGKAYWQQFRNAPDFVVLFIPGEQFLSAAMDIDSSLYEDALRRKVILATPTSLIALLRAVAYGWRQQALAENAERIRELGEDIYKRLATFGEHLGKLGKSLTSSVDNYNKTVGSLERQVLPGARKFTEMGISAKKPIEELDALTVAAREPQVLAENTTSEDR